MTVYTPLRGNSSFHSVGLPRWTSFVLSLVLSFSAGLLLASLTGGPGSHLNSVVSSTGSSSSLRSGTWSNHTTAAGCSEAWLQQVATHSDLAYVLEDALRHKLQQPSCAASKTTAAAAAAAAPGLDRILFVVMCSSELPERLRFIHEGWLHWVPQRSVLLLSDTKAKGFNITLLPKIPSVDTYVAARFQKLAKTPTPDSYQAANLRDLKALWWLGNKKTQALQAYDWIFFADDDTFVNLPLLLAFLRGVPPHLPLLFGHMLPDAKWKSKWAVPLRGLTFPSGGAGMLFSRVALQQLSRVVLSPRCELGTPQNDVTIGKCCRAAGVAKVHTTRFVTEAKQLHTRPSRLDAGMLVTTHRCKTRAQAMEYTCLVSARFGWPHPACNASEVSCGAACEGPLPNVFDQQPQ